MLSGLLDAVPEPIPVQVRRPMFIRDIFAEEPGGTGLTEATAYGRSRLGRVGWHDDALLSLPTDMGTYAQPGWDRERELQWCSNHGRFTPFGGETVPPSARTPIAQVVRELELLHACYLNSAYHRGTLEAWRNSEYRGLTGLEYVGRRLGHRLVADRLAYTPTVAPGGELKVVLDLHNAGFAAPHLPREVAFVLSRGDRALRISWTTPTAPVGPGSRHRHAPGGDSGPRRRAPRPLAPRPAPRGPLAAPAGRRPVRDPPGERRGLLRRGERLERPGRGRGDPLAAGLPADIPVAEATTLRPSPASRKPVALSRDDPFSIPVIQCRVFPGEDGLEPVGLNLMARSPSVNARHGRSSGGRLRDRGQVQSLIRNLSAWIRSSDRRAR